jgi:hypothetical protein
MGSSGKESQTGGLGSRPLKPLNLTAAAEPMLWAEACRMISISGPTAALEVRGLTHAENARQNDGSHEIVYIIVGGFGALQHGDTAIECTSGDVLFVPKGCPHRFERLDGEIKIWRISAADRP